ncbi:MAG: MltA domain-containing protein [Pseudomonadota bacterium]|nr:MltA domain-containing protein [Pseudomonadota bacterium]
MRRWGALAIAVLLAACSGGIVPPSGPSGRPAPHRPYRQPPARQPVPATPIAPIQSSGPSTGPNAARAGIVAGPSVASLPISQTQAARALDAFRLSCATLQRRTDSSGLTRPGDWQPACAAAQQAGGDPRDFFARWFETAQVGDGRAYATGYYIPEIAGSRARRSGYDVPVYGRPSDLIDVDLGLFSDSLKGKKIRGRVEGSNFIPYYDRAAIELGAIDNRAPIIAWAADTVEMFFLQVQGSGILRLPDGQTLRIGYDSQNGRDYTGIGALMKNRGLIGPGQTSMQGIVQWLHDHPDQARGVMDENKSFVFFRVLDGPPVGALGVAVTGGTSAAVDPKFIPLGAPVFLSMDRTDATNLWIAQDTGGAIKGANRVDTFWGSGDEARAIAGGMSARGTAFVLLPIGTVARLSREGFGGGASPQR